MSEVNSIPRTSNEDQAVAKIEALLGNEGEDSIIESPPEETEADYEEEVEVADESEDESETEQEESEEAESDEDEEETEESIETLAELAEAMGMSIDDLSNHLKDRIKVDGEESEVTLAELKAGYQKDRDYRQKTEALKREREAWEADRANYVQSVEQQHQIAAYILNQQEQALAEEMNSQEMALLKERDENKWLVRRREFEDSLQGIQSMKYQAAEQLEQFRQQQQGLAQQQLQEKLAQEQEILERDLPNLDRTALATYLSNEYGFTPDEVGQVYDSRVVKLAEKARLYDQQQSKAEATVAKVKKAPKVPKPSKPQSPARMKRSELAKVKAKLKKSGKLEDAAEWAMKSGLV